MCGGYSFFPSVGGMCGFHVVGAKAKRYHTDLGGGTLMLGTPSFCLVWVASSASPDAGHLFCVGAGVLTLRCCCIAGIFFHEYVMFLIV